MEINRVRLEPEGVELKIGETGRYILSEDKRTLWIEMEIIEEDQDLSEGSYSLDYEIS